MREPRSAGAIGTDFPYQLQTMSYIEITNDGTVSSGTDSGTYQRLRTGKSRLFAVWPGQWRSDLFEIDDIDAYAKGVGIIHDEARSGLADHEHDVQWSISPYESNPSASYIDIKVALNCGCQIKDLDTFATQMRKQRGWDIATTVGWGSGGGTYSMRARRKSLDTGGTR